MRQLTINGYLERYVRSLSYGNTNNIFKLVNEVKNKHHRLREPLFLYALSVGKINLVLRAATGDRLHTVYSELADKYSWDDMLVALESKDNSLDSDFHKTYNSYIRLRNMPITNNNSKMLMHSKIKRLQQDKHISNYRIYTDLKLNPGNVNAYLKRGDVNKIGLRTVDRIVEYLECAGTYA